MDIAVIGTGLCGFAAAQALVDRGLRPTVLDVGESLDAERRAAVARLKEVPPDLWPPEDDTLLRHNDTFGKSDLPKKVHFGSDYIYAHDRAFAPLVTLSRGRAPYPTFAKGGFSNIWGTAVLPVHPSDMADWPVTQAAMAPHFRKVAQLLPICGGEGTLEAAFPAYRDDLGKLDAGPQGDALLADLRRAEHRLSELHILFGKARLAIHTTTQSESELACTGCGECVLGCVRGSMFPTVPSLERLARDDRIGYQAATFVRRLCEKNGKVFVAAVDPACGRERSLAFDAVFVAAGPINSTRLLLQSMGHYGRPVFLKESQKFVIPMLRWRRAPTSMERSSVTLASAFIEVKVPAVSDHWVHIQVVPMNRLVIDGVDLPGMKTGNPLWRPLLQRTMMGFCGLHSDHSSHVVLSLRKSTGFGADTLELDLRVSDKARRTAHVVARDLFRKGFAFGTMFCPWLTKFSNPGSGTHCGSSFPMRREPKHPFDSDMLGRPFGLSRVFVVDSSVLPSIPGTTLAFTAMTNAHRIASLAPIEALS